MAAHAIRTTDVHAVLMAPEAASSLPAWAIQVIPQDAKYCSG